MGYRTALICGCAIALAPQLAHAATDTDAPTAASGDTFGEIIVTAQKRSDSIQKIPGAISALSSLDIERRGVTDLATLANQVPNVNFANMDGASFLTVRGVGTAVDNGYVEPSVATYVDGVYLSRSTMGFLDHNDLERIEVLRGPQGTLYGRNATGGAINFISRKPSDHLEAGATFTTGNYSQVGLKGYVGGPLTDSLRLRISGGFEKRDGYVTNLLDGSDIANINNRYVRGALEADLASNLTLDLTAQYTKQTGRLAYQQVLIQAAPLPPGTLFTTDPWKLYAESPYDSRLETFIASGTLNWQLGDQLALRSITGYVDHKSHTTFDGDGTSLPLINVTDFVRPAKTFSQEFNLTGENGGLKWLVGLYYFHENFFVQLPAPLPMGIPGLLPPGSTPIPSQRDITNSYAAFTDFTYAITDRLRLIGGMRYYIETKKFDQADGFLIPGAGFVGIQNLRSKQRDEKFLPKVGLQYDVTSNVNVYAQFQIGQKSGGVNINLSPTGQSVPYSPEKITAYEAGIKGRLAGGSILFSAAGFYYKYKDLQVFKVTGGAVSLVESADAEIGGLEGEVNMMVARNLKVNAAATWLDTRYTRYDSLDPSNPGAGVQDLKGRSLTRAPDYTVNLGADWTIPFAGGDDLTLRGEVFRSGKFTLIPFPQADEPKKGYTTANFFATLSLADGKYSLRGYITNVFNKAYLMNELYSPLQGAFLGAYAPPRQYGMSVSVKM